MDYKIIVLDLNGTLTNRDKIITPRAKEALMKAWEAGNVVVLALGRPMAGVEPLARELELSHLGSYILSCNRGMIANYKTGETVFSSLLLRESNQKVTGLAEKRRVDILTYGSGGIIINNEEYLCAIAESSIDHLPLRQVEDMKFHVDFRVPKFLILGGDDYLVTVEPKVKTAMGRGFSVYRSEPYFLEIMLEGIGRAQSLTHLPEVLGFKQKQMVACGDGYDGLTVVKYIGLGMAVENAVLPMRQATGYITTSDNHDGIEVVVEKSMLS